MPEERRERAQGLTGGVIAFDLALGAINDEQRIEAPADARPLDELLGGLQAGQGQPGQGSETPQEAPPQDAPPNLSPYERCVAEAGDDIGKLQECASLQCG